MNPIKPGQNILNQINQAPAPSGGQRQNVWWVGADGNVWARSGDQVTNYGAFDGPATSGDGFNARYFSAGDTAGVNWSQIADPAGVNPGVVPGGGTGTGTQFQDTTAARAGTQTSLDYLDTVLGNKNAKAQGDYDALLGTYGEEEAANAASYNKNVETNEGTREAQQQAALLAAANGGRGLYSTLASIGALGGTGKLLANRAVSNEANLDIGAANKTFDTNATNLFDSYGQLKKQEKQRKLDAENILKETKQTNQYDTLSTRQSLLKEMADLWGKAGNNAESNRYLGEASALTSQLAANTRPNVQKYATAPLQYSAPALKGYLAGANDMSVNTSAGSQLPINGAIYTSTKKRDKI